MTRKSLLWQLYPSYIIVTTLVLVAVVWFASSAFKSFYLRQTQTALEREANLIRLQIAGYLEPEQRIRLQSLCQSLGKQSDTRITVIIEDGSVVADSMEDPRKMDNHRDRPEIRQAFSKQTGMSIRPSTTLMREMYMYVAIPVLIGENPVAVVRTAFSLGSVENTLWSIYTTIFIGGLVAALLLAIVSLAVSKRISAPLERLRVGAGKFAKGELSFKIETDESKEIAELAEALNEMVRQLDARMRTVISQRNERNAILSSMVEGVLAVNSEQKVIILNTAAAEFFEIEANSAKGRPIQEVVRNSDLHRFISHLLETGLPDEREITVHRDTTQHYQVIGTALNDEEKRNIGALVVMHDVTNLKRLENIRRDFVANVSHELRTPITSIKGFVETLLDGAINNPEDAKRFLGIIAKHADRLNSIIEDLLSLSRIEQKGEENSIQLERHRIRPILASAIEALEAKISQKKMLITLNCDASLEWFVNRQLIEQAVVNLLDNAIKFSETGKPVLLEAKLEGESLVISVEDKGFGIAKEHHDRLFERFYRVDKARSRTMGGTGLGLSIAKHIAKLHGGYPSVESEVGRGSIFKIHLPTTK